MRISKSVMAAALGAMCLYPSIGSSAPLQYEQIVASAAHDQKALMHVGTEVAPPVGHVGFCQRNPADCAGGTPAIKPFVLTRKLWQQLVFVNDHINRTIPAIEDRELYGRIEYWTYATKQGGDCEDYALLKRKWLIDRGWPPQALLLAVVREQNGAGHAVLVASTDQGDFVLDNQTRNIVRWHDAPYRWVKRQSPTAPARWVSLEQADEGMGALATAGADSSGGD